MTKEIFVSLEEFINMGGKLEVGTSLYRNSLIATSLRDNDRYLGTFDKMFGDKYSMANTLCTMYPLPANCLAVKMEVTLSPEQLIKN